MRALTTLASLLLPAVALAGEEAAPAAGTTQTAVEDAQVGYVDQVSSQESFIPIRGQYVRTPKGHDVAGFNLSWFLSEFVAYDDNVYLENSDEDGDTFFVTTLGARVRREGPRTALDLTGALVDEAYLHESEASNLGGFVDLAAIYGGPKGGYVRIGERFLSHEESAIAVAIRPATSALFLDPGRAKQTENVASIAGGSHGDRTSWEVGYYNFFRDYGSPLHDLDDMEHRGTAILTRSDSPKFEWNAQLEGRSLRYRTDLNNDYTTFAGYLGGRWVASPKTTITGRAGFLGQSADDNGTSGDDSEYRGGVGDIAAVWAATPKVFVDANVGRDIYPAIDNNYQLIHVVSAGARWEAAPRWLVRARLSWQDSRNSDFDNGDGNYWTATAGVSYVVAERWQITLQYQYEQFDADDMPFADYTDNRLGLQVSFVF